MENAFVGIGCRPRGVHRSRQNIQAHRPSLQRIGLGRLGILDSAVLRIVRVIDESESAAQVGHVQSSCGIHRRIKGIEAGIVAKSRGHRGAHAGIEVHFRDPVRTHDQKS